MKLARPPRFPFELVPIIIYGILLFGSTRVYFDSPRFNFLFIVLASVLPLISLSWALVFNRGAWRKPTVLFAVYVVILSLAMVILTWCNDGAERVVQDRDSSGIQLLSESIEGGRIVAVTGIANGATTNIVSVYKDKQIARGIWLRSLIYSAQIYDIDHLDLKANELDIVTRGKVPETKKVPL
jgi:hypothetical protein